MSRAGGVFNEDLYAVLNASPQSTYEELKKYYQKQLLQCHPDKLDPTSTTDVKQRAEKMYSSVGKAWWVLSNQERRKEYDSQVKEEKLSTPLPVFDTVTLEEMDWDEESECYCYLCRCGGEYAISDSDTKEQVELVCCDTCTLGLRIIYPENNTLVGNVDSPR